VQPKYKVASNGVSISDFIGADGASCGPVVFVWNLPAASAVGSQSHSVLLFAIGKNIDFIVARNAFLWVITSPLFCCGGEQAPHWFGASHQLLNLKGTFTNFTLKTNTSSL
tara:strand:- start:27 stop:359 length:333 start_codon:yes stop_codon:yes gene_type:complete